MPSLASRFARANNYMTAAMVGGVALGAGELMLNVDSYGICITGCVFVGSGVGLTLPSINMMIIEVDPESPRRPREAAAQVAVQRVTEEADAPGVLAAPGGRSSQSPALEPLPAASGVSGAEEACREVIALTGLRLVARAEVEVEKGDVQGFRVDDVRRDVGVRDREDLARLVQERLELRAEGEAQNRLVLGDQDAHALRRRP